MKTVLAASLYNLWIPPNFTNHRLAVNVFCVHIYIWSFDVLSHQFVAILCFSTCSNEFPINLSMSIYWLVYAKVKTQDCEFCFFLSHFYLWIFVFLDLELNPDHDWIQNSFKNISYQDLIGWSKELSERRTKVHSFDVLLYIYMIFVWLWWKAIVRFTVSL